MIEAVVQAGSDQTPYLRCGRGERVVIVLAADAEARLQLIGRYAAECRVIAPVPREDAAPEWDTWLCGVIEGLGLEYPEVVLAPDLAAIAERLACGCRALLGSVTTAQDEDASTAT